MIFKRVLVGKRFTLEVGDLINIVGADSLIKTTIVNKKLINRAILELQFLFGSFGFENDFHCDYTLSGFGEFVKGFAAKIVDAGMKPSASRGFARALAIIMLFFSRAAVAFCLRGNFNHSSNPFR